MKPFLLSPATPSTHPAHIIVSLPECPLFSPSPSTLAEIRCCHFSPGPLCKAPCGSSCPAMTACHSLFSTGLPGCLCQFLFVYVTLYWIPCNGFSSLLGKTANAFTWTSLSIIWLQPTSIKLISCYKESLLFLIIQLHSSFFSSSNSSHSFPQVFLHTTLLPSMGFLPTLPCCRRYSSFRSRPKYQEDPP